MWSKSKSQCFFSTRRGTNTFAKLPGSCFLTFSPTKCQNSHQQNVNIAPNKTSKYLVFSNTVPDILPRVPMPSLCGSNNFSPACPGFWYKSSAGKLEIYLSSDSCQTAEHPKSNGFKSSGVTPSTSFAPRQSGHRCPPSPPAGVYQSLYWGGCQHGHPHSHHADE